MAEGERGMLYHIGVQVTLHAAVLDPQGLAVLRGLQALGFDAIEEVHAGTFFRLSVRAADADAAMAEARRACERLLTNPVIETFTLAIEDAL